MDVIPYVTLTADLLTEYRTYLSVYKSYRPITYLNEAKVMQWIERYLAERPFSLENCLEYISFLKTSGKSPSTLATVVRSIKLFNTFLEFKGYAESFNHKLPSIRVDPVEIKTLSIDEIQRIIACPFPDSPHLPMWSLFIEILARTGRRIADIQNLKVSNLNFDESTFTIPSPKGRQPEYQPMPEDLCNRLRDLCEGKHENSYVFSSVHSGNEGKPIATSTVRWILQERGKRCKINKAVSPHKLRHSFPRELFAKRSPLPQVSSLLGHKNYETTKRYTHLVVEDKRDASNSHPLNQQALTPVKLVETMRTEDNRYIEMKRPDLKITVELGTNFYTRRVEW